MASQAMGEMPGPTHQQKILVRDMETWALSSPPHSKQLSGHTAGLEVTDPDLQASFHLRFHLRKTVSKAPLGVFSPLALPSIQLFFFFFIPFADG